jgi:8-oxo-dGTP diphosphatase
MSISPPTVAIAILYRQDSFLMQLRDNIPGIVYPGCWGFFGGHLEPGETPETALRRELMEEINYRASDLAPFRNYQDGKVIRHVFFGPLTVGLAELDLQEGWDMALLSPEVIRQGECYSVRAQQQRPLGQIHQKILLDFMDTALWIRQQGGSFPPLSRQDTHF